MRRFERCGVARRSFRLSTSGLLTLALLLMVLVVPNGTVLAAEDPPDYVTQWNPSAAPWGLGVSSGGNIYVAETFSNRVNVYDSEGSYTGELGSGQFLAPTHVAFDADGNIYVADSDHHRIVKFDSSHTYVIAWGSQGSADGQFQGPYGLGVDSDGNVYVADMYNQRVQKFDSAGNHLATWGGTASGTGPKEFNEPIGIAVDGNDNVYVAERFNHRVQKFDSAGTHLATWGGTDSGSGDGEFALPMSICVDADDNVYVAEAWNDRIQKFSAAGVFLCKWGAEGTGEGEFNNPFGVAAGTDDVICVADYGNARIQVFQYQTAQDVEIALQAGWNMVSVPVEADDMSVGAVFPDAEAVYTWNPTSKSYETPSTIDPKKSYWVAMTSPGDATVTGTPVTEWRDALSSGWNMAGSVYGDPVDVANLSDDPSGSVQTNAIYHWNPTAKSYDVANNIEQGLGYWMAATQGCDVTVAPSA